MNENLGFEVTDYDDGLEGRFTQSRALRAADDKISDELDRYEGGRMSREQLVASMNARLAQFPDLFEAHATIGYVLLEKDPATALRHYQIAFATGLAAMPADFDGKVIYGDLNNRAFLRAVHGLALAHQALGDHQKCVNVLERSLRDPNDNLGCRMLLEEYVGKPGVTVTFDLSVYEQGQSAPRI